MLVGHYAVGLAIRSRQPDLPLWVLFLAVQALDLVWTSLVLLGVERTSFVTNLPSVPFELSYMPYSHGLPGAVLWSLGAGIAAHVVLSRRRAAPARLPAAWIGLAVFSHWLLDLLVHRPDLPLYDDVHKVGLALWNHPLPALALELAFLGVGLLVYLRSGAGAAHRRAVVGLGLALAALQVAVVYAPRPSELPIPAAMLGLAVFYAAATAVAAWVDSGARRWQGRPPT